MEAFPTGDEGLVGDFDLHVVVGLVGDDKVGIGQFGDEGMQLRRAAAS